VDIAAKYEKIIKSQNEDLEKWDKKFKLKERECYELKMRTDVLQRRLADDEAQAISPSPSITKQLSSDSLSLPAFHPLN
jgi:hypothetical protein